LSFCFYSGKEIGPVGSGLLSIQGTSFTFLGSVIATVLAVIVILNTSKNNFIRMGAIFIGLLVG